MSAPEKKIPLIRAYRADTNLIQRSQGMVTHESLLVAATALAERLPKKSHIINLCHDRYYFILGFCAALIKGATTLLPPNRQVRTINELAADFRGCYCLTDTGNNHNEINVTCFDISQPCFNDVVGRHRQSLVAPPLIAENHLAAIAFTSGSTGKPKPNKKHWYTLVGVAHMLAERFFGDDSPSRDWRHKHRTAQPSILATVPSQHMYGLEMTVMMALQGSALLHNSHPFYPEDVAATLTAVSQPRVLVTTPVHLRAISRAEVGLPKVDKCISATAPLDVALARQAEQLFCGCVEEIYGCTEAGSMATRRTAVERVWTLLNGMEIATRGKGVEVSGPQLVVPTPLQDRFGIVTARTFHLLGRSTDLLNVGGKRASLSDLSQRLLNIDGVDDAVVFLPQGDGGIERPAALVVSTLSEREILSAMSKVVDAVFLPRPLKKVSQIPRNETGKITYAQASQALEGTK